MGRLCAIALLLVACSGKTKPKAKERFVTVSIVEGDATQLGVQVKPGDQLKMDEFLFVGDGKVELAMSWAGTLRVFPHSTLLLANIAGEEQRADVMLAVGKVWALIQGLNGTTFDIATQNAVAGVRGTEFVVEADDKESDVYVVEGEVAVHSLADPKTKRAVKAKQRTHVAAAAPAKEPESHESVVHKTQWTTLKPQPASWPASLPTTPNIAPQPTAPPEPEKPEPEKPAPQEKHKAPQKKPTKAEPVKEEQPPPPPPPPPPDPAADPAADQGPKRPAFEVGAPTKGKRGKALKPPPPPTNWPPKP